jgi:hypothetical protein
MFIHIYIYTYTYIFVYTYVNTYKHACTGQEEFLIVEHVENIYMDIETRNKSVFIIVSRMFKYNILNRIEMITTAIIPALTLSKVHVYMLIRINIYICICMYVCIQYIYQCM